MPAVPRRALGGAFRRPLTGPRVPPREQTVGQILGRQGEGPVLAVEVQNAPGNSRGRAAEEVQVVGGVSRIPPKWA